MKDRLKILFGFLRGLKVDNVETRIALDRSYIEDWEGKFYSGNQHLINIPGFIEDILEKLIEVYMDEFYRYVDLDIDEWWYLYITIYPKENKLVFESSCKVRKVEKTKNDFKVDDLSDKALECLNYLYEYYQENNLTIIDFDIQGSWDDGDASNLYLDKKRIRSIDDIEEKLWEIGNNLAVKSIGKYWNAESGAEFTVRIWGDDIFMDGASYSEEYEDTGMEITVTPDNVLEEE